MIMLVQEDSITAECSQAAPQRRNVGGGSLEKLNWATIKSDHHETRRKIFVDGKGKKLPVCRRGDTGLFQQAA